MALSSKAMGYLMAIFAVVVWSGNFVAARAVAFSIPPMHMNFWRWAVALACLLPFAIGPLRRDWPVLKKHLPYTAFMGLVGVTCLNAFFYQAGSTTSSINMVLFVPSAPILIMVLSRVLCGEPITYRRLTGLVIILLGLLLLISRGQWETLQRFDISMGDLWSIGGVSCFGVYSFFSRYRPKVNALSFLLMSFSFGLLFCLPVFVWEIFHYPPINPPIWENSGVIIAILYSGIGCSTVAYFAWAHAIDAIGPVAAGMIYYSIPLFTALGGVLILGESVTLVHVFGAALMLMGIVLATVTQKVPKP